MSKLKKAAKFAIEPLGSAIRGRPFSNARDIIDPGNLVFPGPYKGPMPTQFAGVNSGSRTSLMPNPGGVAPSTIKIGTSGGRNYAGNQFQSQPPGLPIGPPSGMPPGMRIPGNPGGPGRSGIPTPIDPRMMAQVQALRGGGGRRY